MRRTLLILLTSITVTIVGTPTSTRAAVTISAPNVETLRDATNLLKENRAADALAKLAPLATTLKDNPDFETLYGLTLLEAQKPRESILALRRAIAAQPDNLIARAHLGRALATVGDLTNARREIAAINDRPDLADEIRVVMIRNLETIDDALKQRAQATNQQQVAQTTTVTGSRPSDNDLATIRSAAQLVRAKKSAAALAKLDPLAARLAGYPDFDYVYGVAALDAGHPAQAAVALRRALAARPGFHLARAELGRALAAMGDLAGAKREFEVVRDTKGVPVVARDAMGREVMSIDQAVSQLGPTGPQTAAKKPETPQPRTRISGYLEQGIGYDTNVNAGPTNQSLLIPALAFLGPATISRQAIAKKSGFYELAGGLSISHSINDGTAAFANLVGNWHPLFDHNEFRTALVGGEAGIAHKVDNLGIFSVAAIGQTFTQGDNIFRNLYGTAAQWRQRYADAWDLSLSMSWLALEYPSQIGQNTDRYSVIGTIARKWSEMPLAPAISITGTVGKEIARTDGMDFLSYTIFGARVSFETTWTPRLGSFLQLAYEDHSYDADYPLFFTHRHDNLLDMVAGFEVKLTEQVSLRPSVHYSETKSNIGLFDQKRWITAMTLHWPL